LDAKRKYGDDAGAARTADDVLWHKFRQGDVAAFELLFKKYNPVLTQYGVRFFHDPELVEDCVQELFLHLWKRRDRLEDVKVVKYYLITSLRRLLLRNAVLVKRQADINSSVGREHHVDVPSEESRLIRHLSNKEVADQLILAIQQLPPRQREAVYLKYYEEKSYEEITSIMSVNYQTARKFIYKGLQVIRKTLSGDPRFGK